MSRGEKTDLGHLALHNRAAARLLNVRGVLQGVTGPKAPDAASSGTARKARKDRPILLIAVQMLVVVGCLVATDRLALDGKLATTLGDQMQVVTAHMRMMWQRLPLSVWTS